MDGYPVYLGTIITPAGAALEVWATSADVLPQFQVALSDYLDGAPGAPLALFFSSEFRLRDVRDRGVNVSRGLSEQRKAEIRAQLERMEPKQFVVLDMPLTPFDGEWADDRTTKAQEQPLVEYKCACCKDARWVSASFGNMMPCPLCGPML